MPELVQRLARLPRTAQTRDVIQKLLADKRVVGDQRAVVVAAQVNLGYPFALEVAPEDLELLRQSTPKLGSLAAWLVVSAVVSLGWNAMIGVSLSHAAQPFAAPFFVACAHALLAVGVTAIRPKHARRWYAGLGWAGLLGPLAALGAAGFVGFGLDSLQTGLEPGLAALAALATLFVAAPLMVTARACWGASKQLARPDPHVSPP